jgi:hypothetical protein
VTDILTTLRRELGDAVRSDAATLAAHSADAWVMAELDALENAPRATPLAVLAVVVLSDILAARLAPRAPHGLVRSGLALVLGG